MIRKFLFFFGLLALLATLSGCASTTLQSVWSDPVFSGKFSRTLVVVAEQNQIVRNNLEDALVREFRNAGVLAVAGYQVFPDLVQIPKKDDLFSRAVADGFDSVLVIRTVGKKTMTIQNPAVVEVSGGWGGWGPGWWGGYRGFYGRDVQMVAMPATTTTLEIYKGESNLFDARTGQSVWAALSETTRDARTDSLINGFARIVVRRMLESRFFAVK